MYVICRRSPIINHFLLLGAIKDETLWPLLIINAPTSYSKCVGVCSLFVGMLCICVPREIAVKRGCFTACGFCCIAIHHSFVSIKLSTLALSFLPSPYLHLGSPPCRYTLKITDSIHSIRPLKCLSLLCSPCLPIGGKTKQQQKAHRGRRKARLTGQMPMIQISPFVVVLLCVCMCVCTRDDHLFPLLVTKTVIAYNIHDRSHCKERCKQDGGLQLAFCVGA